MMVTLGVLRVVEFIVLRILQCLVFIFSIPNYFEEVKKCPPIDDEILLFSARRLAEKIRKREINCQTVVKAYISRIRAVNPIINAVVEDRFANALHEAKSQDEMLSTTLLDNEELKTKYPLLGIPITIKGSIALEGLDHGSGRVFAQGKRASKNARAVQLIRDAGAIPLLVSNTPELCMALETYNNVTGRTNNPYDTRRTPGGSSGGEAALLGAGASLIGIGSDLVGSIRLPANYCGIWGHKPSTGAVSLNGHYPDSREQEQWTYLLSIGPLCRYAEDLTLLYKVMIEKPLQLDEKVSLRNLNFYMMENDGGSILTSPVEDEILLAMRRFKNHLETKYRVKVQKLTRTDFSCVEAVHLKALGLKEIDTLFDNNNNKGPYSELLQYILGKSKATITPILQGILNGIVTNLSESVQSWPDQVLSKTKETFLTELGPNGVLIYPSHPRASHIHGQMLGRYFDYHYTGIFNGLGVPATNCPVGLNYKGLPIGIQIVAAPNNDRLTLAVAQEVEIAFGGWIPPSVNVVN